MFITIYERRVRTCPTPGNRRYEHCTLLNCIVRCVWVSYKCFIFILFICSVHHSLLFFKNSVHLIRLVYIHLAVCFIQLFFVYKMNMSLRIEKQTKKKPSFHLVLLNAVCVCVPYGSRHLLAEHHGVFFFPYIFFSFFILFSFRLIFFFVNKN